MERLRPLTQPNPAMGKPADKLEILSVTKQFTSRDGGAFQAVDEIDITVGKNEIVCLVGPSGCGKSTLLNMVAGFEAPTAGQILIDGKPVDGPGPDRGVVFQEHALFPWMTALDNVAFGPRVRGEDDHAARARHYLAQVGLEGFENTYPRQLSGGMRQRVALARVLANEPDVLLMDEPFGALDAQTRLQMQELLLDVWRQRPTTILFVTHDIDEAIFVADRVLVMSASPGRIVASFDIDLPKPRNYHLLGTQEFLELKEPLLELVRSQTRRDPKEP